MDDKVLEIIAQTRSMLLPHYGAVEEKVKPGQHRAGSVVTELDLTVERHLAAQLKKLDASIAFVGEEFGGSREAARYWLCDPIDGTMHFVRGLPFCSVMLALVEDGAPSFSVIYDFVRDHMYHARRGHGSYMDRSPIRVSERPIDRALIAYESRIERGDNRALYEAVRARSMIFHSVTSGFEFCQVAAGRIDARICIDAYGKDYDFVPGALLVEEAGGVVRNRGSRTYDIGNLDLIASNPVVYAALTEGEGAVFPIVG